MVEKLKKQVAAWSPGLVVLQWLSYAFWGLAVFALAYVVYTTTLYYIDTTNDVTPEAVVYGVAALFILSPLAIVADIFHSRRESANKHAVSAVVMVIHAVLAALIALVSLVVLVFTSVSLLLTTATDTATVPKIITASVLFVLFAVLLVRIARPTLLTKLRWIVRLTIAAIITIVIGFAIAGPVVYTLQTREDRDIRDSLNTVNMYITQSVSDTTGLPATIDLTNKPVTYGPYDVNANNTAKRLVAEGKITYQANTKPSTVATDQAPTSTTYYYRLCATFSHSLRDSIPAVSYPYPVASSAAYQDSIDLSHIVAGTKCFNLKTTLYHY